MTSYKTITKHLTKIYISQLLITLVVIIGIICVTNTFDTLQKFKSINFSIQQLCQLVLCKVPYLFCEISSLSSFATTILFLNTISKQNILIVIVSNGIALWRVYLTPVSVTLVFGIVIVIFIHPIGTYGLRKYEQVREYITKTKSSNLTNSNSNIFFFEKLVDSSRIIQAESIDVKEKILLNSTILILDLQNNLDKKIDSPTVSLTSGFFVIKQATVTDEGSKTNSNKIILLPTSLSIDDMVKSITRPETMYIWTLKNSIEKLKKLGLAVTKYQIYYYKQVFKPISMIAMTLVACWFIDLNTRNHSESNSKQVIRLVLGISLYLFIEVITRILSYTAVHPILAALLPLLFIISLSIFVVLHFQ